VSATLVEVDRETLWTRMQRGDEIVLVDALPPIAFAASRIRGAINIPPESVDALAERRLPDLGTEIVVYCANPDCESSVEVAERLVELGYRNVAHFAGGKDEWREAGLPLEGGRV
jgi:rhodanese-related sulfurtransferase